MLDAVNIVGIIVYQRYWDNKIRVCRAYQKTSVNPVTKPKGKRKRTSCEMSYRHNNWSTVELWRCSELFFNQNVGNLQNMKSIF